MSLEEQLRNDAQSLREVGWFNRAIMMDAAANEIQKLKDRIKRLEEQNYTLRARLYPTRPRIQMEKRKAIADAPQNISISELARKFDVSYGTVARYRRQIKAKEDKL